MTPRAGGNILSASYFFEDQELQATETVSLVLISANGQAAFQSALLCLLNGSVDVRVHTPHLAPRFVGPKSLAGAYAA